MNTSKSTLSITPESAGAKWGDWRWQMRHRLQTPDAWKQALDLDPSATEVFAACSKRLPVALTPYYAHVLQTVPGREQLLRCVLPMASELTCADGERRDPLGEETHSPVPGLVHRYPDRVLLLALGQCPVYCRFCTRARMVGHEGAPRPNRRRWQQAIDYIRADPEIHDVLISGGDPLILGDTKLAWLLSRLQAIPQLDLVRIGTKVPTVLPMRITDALLEILRQHSPIYLSLHINHPDELTSAMCAACERLADAGVVMGSQTVLLRGVNDSAETLRRLFRGLLRIRIRPYYLLQGDPIVGSEHFRTPIQRGLDILEELRGRISGYGIPQFIIDLPGGHGKIPLVPDYACGREGNKRLFRGPDGAAYCPYPDCH